jgi:MoaA/NifB/PqqE/SkfB family radical SAM enzyme
MSTPSALPPHSQPIEMPRLPVHRARPERFDYDIECDWLFLWTCNYRCSYCFVSPGLLGSKIKVHATPEEWRAAFDATGKRWLIHLTGGEPTVYPDFLELCEALTESHTVSLNSNLSRPVVRKLAGRVDPARVSFVNAGLHAAERLRQRGIEEFMRNARFLQDAGFRVVVSVVATPEIIPALPALSSLCAAHGLQLAPKVLRGSFGGRVYPNGYIAEEKRQLLAAILRARHWYDAAYAGWPRPSIDVFSDDDLLDGEPNFRGLLCSAGQRFVRVSADGEVDRCNPEPTSGMGNLLKRTVRFAAGPAPCNTQYCVYFCKKYTAETLTRLPPRASPPV